MTSKVENLRLPLFYIFPLLLGPMTVVYMPSGIVSEAIFLSLVEWMMRLGVCADVFHGKRLFMMGFWSLVQLRNEGNGCPFLGPLWVARKAAISLELEWARWVFAAWTTWNRFLEAQA